MKRSALFLALSYALPAMAQISLNPVTVEGEKSQAKEAVYSAPKSSVYIAAEDFNKFAILSPGDVLKNQAGVELGDVRNGGGLDVNIRGLQGQSRVAVRVDGTQQALDVYRGYAGTQQRSYIDPALISEIVVNKGTDMNGIGALGGAVEMKTISAQEIIPAGKQFGVKISGKLWNNTIKADGRTRNGAEIDDDYEYFQSQPAQRPAGILSGNYAHAGSIAFAYRNDYADIVAAVAKSRQGNYFAGRKGYEDYREYDKHGDEVFTVAKSYKAGEEVLNSASDTQSVLLKAGFYPSAEQEFGLNYQYYQGKFGEIMPSDIMRYERGGNTQYPYGLTNIHRLSADYRYQPQDNPLIDFNARAWITQAKTEQITAVEVPKSQEYVTDRGWVRLNNTRYGLDLGNRAQIGDVNLTFGASLQNERIKPQSGVDISDNDRFSNRHLRDAKRFEYAFNTQLDYQPHEQITLWAGAKYQGYKSEDLNRVAVPQREERKYKPILVASSGWRNYGFLNWFPDAKGEYNDSNDPRKSNGIVYKDESNPFDGLNYQEFKAKYGIEHENIRGENTREVVTGFNFAEKKTQKDQGLSFSAGIKYEFVPESFAYISYTQGLRLPSLFETTIGTPQTLAGDNLSPEKLRSWEIGLSSTQRDLFKENDRLSGKIAYFHNSTDNYITRYWRPNNNGIMTFENTDKYQVDGIELQGSYHNKHGYLDLSATHYLHTHTCDKDFAEVLSKERGIDVPHCTDGSYGGSYTNTQNPPKYALNLGAGLYFLDGKLSLGGRMRYTSAPTAKIDKAWQRSPTTPQIYYRPVSVYDAFVQYRPSDNSEINLSLNNLTNRYYLDPLAQSYMPAPGRNAQLSFSYRF